MSTKSPPPSSGETEEREIQAEVKNMTTTLSTKSLTEHLVEPLTFEPLDWNEYTYPNPSEKEAYNQFWFYCSVGTRPEDPSRIESTGVQIALSLKGQFDR